MHFRKVNYYCWILWIEIVLDKQEREISNLSLKLDLSTKKSRNSLNEFKNDLFIKDDSYYFYCGCKIYKSNCHVVHFVPWQFVENDNIWNLVLSCINCNLKKNNKIPKREYLLKINERNNKSCGEIECQLYI